VIKTSPTVQPVGSEYLDVRNCDSTKALDKTLSDFLPVREKVSVSEQATLRSCGKPSLLSGATCRSLRDKVESTYCEEYQAAQRSAQEIAVQVPADKIHMYKVQWCEKIVIGSLAFQRDDDLAGTSFPCNLGFRGWTDPPRRPAPLERVNSRPTVCGSKR
jgi:hypothetical protein